MLLRSLILLMVLTGLTSVLAFNLIIVPIGPPPPPPSYTVNCMSADTMMGTTVGGGTNLRPGDPVTLTAIPYRGFGFVHWQRAETGTIISISNEISFAATESMTLLAVFHQFFPWTATYSGLFCESNNIL